MIIIKKIFLILIFILFLPGLAFSKEDFDFKSLKNIKSNLRHYPEKDDPNLKTIKFVLTQIHMPIKIIGEFNSGGPLVEWYNVELFNGVTGWLYHNQISKNRTLLLKKNKNLYLFNSFNPNSLMTQIKAKIISPKIVILEKIKNNMAKISFSNKGKNSSGWILLDDSIWGVPQLELKNN